MSGEWLNQMVSKEFNQRIIYGSCLVNKIMSKVKVGSTRNEQVTTLKLSDWHNKNYLFCFLPRYGLKVLVATTSVITVSAATGNIDGVIGGSENWVKILLIIGE